MSERVWDAGLQPERTALAWRRTVVAVAVGSLAALRILPEIAGPSGTVFGVVGLVGALALALAAEERHRRVHARLVRSVRTGREPRIGDGALLACVAAGTLALALVGAVVMVTVAARSFAG